jgi:cytidylate kinase
VGEGRDLGTVVFPDADVKLYLDADPDTRAERRHAELAARGLVARLEDVRTEMRSRDERTARVPIAHSSPLRTRWCSTPPVWTSPGKLEAALR